MNLGVSNSKVVEFWPDERGGFRRDRWLSLWTQGTPNGMAYRHFPSFYHIFLHYIFIIYIYIYMQIYIYIYIYWWSIWESWGYTPLCANPCFRIFIHLLWFAISQHLVLPKQCGFIIVLQQIKWDTWFSKPFGLGVYPFLFKLNPMRC